MIGAITSDFFTEEKPLRDGKGQPRLLPRGKTEEADRVSYTRASSMGDYIEDQSFLHLWHLRGLAVSVAKHDDLMRLLAAETYTCGFTDDLDANRASGRRVDKVIERALDRIGVHAKADYGTAVHLRTEAGNLGVDPDEAQAIEVQSCLDLWDRGGVVDVGTEIFTANDETRAAGTFDHLKYIPWLRKIVVTDKKTSAKASGKYAAQLGTYSYGDVYDPETDLRLTMREYIKSRGWDPALYDPSIGFIWWLKGGKTQARQLDLALGREAALRSAWIRDNWERVGVAKDVTRKLLEGAEEARMDLSLRITEAPDIESVRTLWADPCNQAIWTAEHTEAAKGKA